MRNLILTISTVFLVHTSFAASISSAPAASTAQQPPAVSAGATLSTPANEDNTAPAWVAYTGLAVAALTFVYNICRLALEMLQARKSRRISIVDDYWFRNVLMPVSIEPLLKFVIETAEKLKAVKRSYEEKPTNGRKLYDECHCEFVEKKDLMISRVMLLQPVDVEMYKAASAGVDKIEDVVTLHCFAHSHDVRNKEASKYKDISFTVREIYSDMNEMVTALINRHHVRFK